VAPASQGLKEILTLFRRAKLGPTLFFQFAQPVKTDGHWW